MRRNPWAALAAAASLLAGTSLAQAAAVELVNIDATHGFTYAPGSGKSGSDPAPVFGDPITPIGQRIELDLDAGTYEITNAWAQGVAGAAFKAWSYNVGTSSWTWAYVLADATNDTVIFWDYAGNGFSAEAVASLEAVQNYRRTLTLDAPARLLFTLRDYYVPDNAGGISLQISRQTAVTVPAPASLTLAALGLALLAHSKRRRQT